MKDAAPVRWPTKLAAVVEGLPAISIAALALAPLLLAWVPAGQQAAMAGGPPAIAWRTLAVSVAVAAMAAALATALGAMLAGAFVLTDFPGRRFWATVALLPFVCPPMVWGLAQVYCYGAGGLIQRWAPWVWQATAGQSDPGHHLAAILVLAEIHVPLAMLIVGRGMGRLGHCGFDAAKLLLPPHRLPRWIVGAVRPELGSAFLLTLAMSLGNHGVPHVLQCRLYPVEVYARIANYLDSAGALWTALPMLMVTLLATGAMVLPGRNREDVRAETPRPPSLIRLRHKVWALGGALFAYLAVTSLLPLAAMIAECQSPGHFGEALRAAGRETRNSLGIGLAAGLAAGLAGLVVGAWASRRNRSVTHVLAIVPLGVPAIILGLTYSIFYNRSWPVDLTCLGGGSILVILALAARGWPFATRIVVDGHRRIAPQWHEAARLGGLGWFGRWRWITGPLIAEHVLGGALIASILALGDVEISQMLCAPGTGTLALRLFSFLHFGPTHVAASLAVWLMILATAPVFAYFLLCDRTLEIV